MAKFAHSFLPDIFLFFSTTFDHFQPVTNSKIMLTRYPVRDINYYKLTNDQKN